MTLPVVFTANGAQGYNLTKSLRFRSSASAYLNRTLSASNRKTFTFNVWVKKAVVGSSTGAVLFCSTDNSTSTGWLHFNTGSYGSADTLTFEDQASGTVLVTTQVFRDPSAWYMITLSIDTTQATSSNRAKLFVNGTQITAFSTATYPSQNADTNFNRTTSFIHTIGSQYTNNRFYDGYLAEVNFIDGQALTPSSFGETSASTGVWQPIKYAGTYGTNGFYLPFTDVATTSGSNAGLGKDFSGNGNYWTTNNISVTSGSTYDSMKDVPTLTDTDTANYWTLNPLNPGQLGTPQSGNLEWIAGDQNNFRTIAAPILPTSGKFYWEVTPIGGGSGGAFVSGIYIGIMNYANGGTGLFASGARIADTGKDDFVYYSDGRKVNLNSFVSYGNSYSANDVVGIAVDIDNGKIWFSKNGTWQASGDPAAGTNAAYTTVPFSTKPYAPAMSAAEITNAQKFNFGQRPFAYTPPTGFVALNTFNLPTPTIGATASSQANKYMDVTVWSGDNTTPRSISNSGSFQPDFVWLKSRSNAYQHNLYDAVRGAGSAYSLSSDQTAAEGGNSNVYGYLSAFNSTGFQVTQGSAGGGGAPNGNAYTNQSGSTYVGWQWKANGSGSTNTAGSITSTVSADTTAGFSIVTYTGTGSTGTVGHGLGVAPAMIIWKNRNATASWVVWHTNFSAIEYIYLNLTNAVSSSSGSTVMNSTLPTSSVFSLGTYSDVNGSTNGIVAYCFAQVAGYSAFGSYTGNGSSDGPFIYTGFRPRYVLIKCSNTTGDWWLEDTSRNTYNVADLVLFPNTSGAESGSGVYYWDFLSNGFKLRSTSAGYNGSGNTYIYAAFAENPFKYSLAR